MGLAKDLLKNFLVILKSLVIQVLNVSFIVCQFHCSVGQDVYKRQVFEGIILHADVASMYPTTDIEYGLLSRKFKNPDDFKQMRNFRLKLKAEGNSKNKALKPMINGVYLSLIHI